MIRMIIDICTCCDLPVEQCGKSPPDGTFEIVCPEVRQDAD